MAKHEKAPESPSPGDAMRATRSRPTPPAFDTPQEERAWFLEQERKEREYAEAASKYPPGSRLFVTTARGIARRSRAGISFTEKGRTEVEIVDMDDDTLARVRTLTQPQIEKLQKGEALPGLEGVDGKTAARIASSPATVTPLGAKAIAEDDGLVVFADAGGKASADPSEADRRISELEAENKSLREQLARKTSGGEGRPERLSRSSDFGGSDDKAKG